MGMMTAFTGGDGGWPTAIGKVDVVAIDKAAAEVVRIEALIERGADAKRTALAGLPEMREARKASVLAGEAKAIDAVDRKIVAAEREVERADLMAPELAGQLAAARAALAGAQRAAHHARVSRARDAVAAALDALLAANAAAAIAMSDARSDLGLSDVPWRVTFNGAFGAEAVDLWKGHTARALAVVEAPAVVNRLVEVRYLRTAGGRVMADRVERKIEPIAHELVAGGHAEFTDPDEVAAFLAKHPGFGQPLGRPSAPEVVVPEPDANGELAVRFVRQMTVTVTNRHSLPGTYLEGESYSLPARQAEHAVRTHKAEFLAPASSSPVEALLDTP